MTKKIMFLSICITVAICSAAQGNKAKSILDKTASAIRNAGDIRADFSATSSSGSMAGTIYIHKNMLHLQSSDVKCWYDGKTLWTYRKSTNEVNITTPTPAEQQSINPYLFINIYKSGYSYALKEVTLRGKACYEVTLTATSATNKLQKMIITVDKSSCYPLKVSMIRSKSTTEINITGCKTKQKFKESTFKFNKGEYSGAEVIDLR